MMEYHKIQTVFLRDPDTKYKTLLEGSFAKPEFEYLKENKWIFTEKVDGTNIRVKWDGETVEFGGKTSKAQLQANLQERLPEMFPAEAFSAWEAPELTLYGEGYGAKIQKGGGNYIPDGCSFILFDVLTGNCWLERFNVEDVADKLGIKVVPIVGEGTLWDAVEMVRSGYDSQLRETSPEGLVMRPQVEMLSRRGKRIISKIKRKDFKP